MTIEEAVLVLKRYQGYEPMEYGNILKHSFDLTDETVDTLLSAIRTETAGEPLTLEQLQHMDEQRELARRMREMAVNTGGLNCLGCGYEHKCGVHGCVVLKRAADLLDPAVDITTPIPLDRLRELEEAEQAGRLVVLPCKVGDTVWYITPSTEVCEAEVIGIWLNVYTNPQMWLEIKYRSKFAGECEHKSRIDLMLGKILFLTREEAETALKGENHEANPV